MPAHPDRGPQLPDRWAIERAAKSADIPPIAKHLILDLATYLDAGSTALPYRWSPSLTGLSRDTRWSRRTVTRWLAWLERTGWLVRLRPTKHDARTRHMRTAYTLRIPDDLGSQIPVSRVTQTSGLGTQKHQARATQTPDLGSQSPGARVTGRLNQTYPDHQTSPDQDREEVELVIKHVQERTGATVTWQQAAAIRDLILARPHTNRRSYLIRTLVTDPKPERWLNLEEET